MKHSLRVPLLAATRKYATRRPERPPSKIRDPLSSSNATHYPVTPHLTFIHRVPPTAPTPFSLTTAPSSPLLISHSSTASQCGYASSSNTSNLLPPPLNPPREKSMQRLNDAQIEEMKRLRALDPIKNTRSKLARQFGCSPLFVPIAAPLTKSEKRDAMKRTDQVHEANRSRWGERKRMAVAIRQRRRELW